MRVYHISCPGCQWKAPLPVDARVADKFRRQKYCVHCREKFNKQVPYMIRETIVTGPTPYFPRKS